MDTDDDYYANPPDPIIAEIWKFREEFSKRFNGDIHAMIEEMRRQSKLRGGGPEIIRPAKRILKPSVDSTGDVDAKNS